MEYNPYAARYLALKDSVSSDEAMKKKWLEQLGWYTSFDASKVASVLSNFIREVDSLEKELKELNVKLAEQKLRVNDLKLEARLGWDPRNWFSKERLSKKRDLSAHKQALARLTIQHNEFQHQMHTKKEQVSQQQAELARYNCFDGLEAEAAVKALDFHLLHLRVELNEVWQLKEQVDHQLREPLAELTEFNRRTQELGREISQAKAFEQKLSNSSNSYERKMVHDACSTTFGEAGPARVISAKQRELQSVNRNIVKLQDRLKSINQRASRIVKTLMIDGNNLCYQHQTFIGLVALEAMAKRLSSNYAVVIVFDAIIRRLLQNNDRDIAARFGETVRVHVVASRQKADETLLDAATDSNTYVISNDRFADFPDKPAVRELRIIRHEILNDKVFVHDLSVAENFATAN